jgi:sulfite exporter TauE/SafE
MAWETGATWAGGALLPVAVGLGSSFTHCAGMCSPIHLYLASRSGRGVWLYHAGRILGYALLGAAAGWLGSRLMSLDTPALRAGAGWLLAGLYAFFALQMLGWMPKRWSLEALFGGLYPARRLGRLASARGASSGSGWLFPAGIVGAALPCPSTHAVLLYGIGLHHPALSSLAMGALGIATLPVFAVLPRSGTARASIFGRNYGLILGVTFLGLAAWRVYGAVGAGTPACH